MSSIALALMLGLLAACAAASPTDETVASPATTTGDTSVAALTSIPDTTVITPDPDTYLYRVRIAAFENPEIYLDIDLPMDTWVEVEGMEVMLHAVNYFPNYAYSFERRQRENLSDDPLNPALQLELITSNLRLPLFWIFQKRPEFRPFTRMPVKLVFLGRIPEHSFDVDTGLR